MSPQYGELRPTSGWDRLTSLGYPCKFQLVSRLRSVTARHLVVGVSQTLRRWTEGATYIWQGDHHVGHWPTFLVVFALLGKQRTILPNSCRPNITKFEHKTSTGVTMNPFGTEVWKFASKLSIFWTKTSKMVLDLSPFANQGQIWRASLRSPRSTLAC